MRSSHLVGVTAAGVILLWGTIAGAQSAAPSELNQPSLPARAQGSSSRAMSMICDDSGQTCIPIGQAKSKSRSQSSPSKLQPATQSVAVSGASGVPTQFEQSQARGLVRSPIICDSSGKICGFGHAASIVAAAPPTSPQQEANKLAARVPRPKAPGSHPMKGRAATEVAQTIESEARDDDIVSDYPLDWAVHAYKSRHRLEVYYKGHLYKTYHAVFGRNLLGGAKLWEGDRRTPEGNYLIVGKHRSSRFGWFLHLNYPNELDRQRFQQGRAAHLIPANAREGGEIGIHGTDSPYLNVAEVDWTTGCISVDNAAISELAHLLPIGTLVVINP
jgi:lipoprotein-anchoring transpeptidase ErfK/SrfK